MKRTTTALAAFVIVIVLAGFTAACGDDPKNQARDSSNGYCAKLPEYFEVMGKGMATDSADRSRYDKWAAKAKEMQAIAPDELQSHWEFLVEYSGRVARVGDFFSAQQPDDIDKNGKAGGAIVEYGIQKCGLPR